MLTIEQEQEIVQQVLGGDTRQYSVIVKEYQDIVANLTYRMVGSKLDVEEVVQQVFVELYSALPRFRHESKLSTFIYRITINVIAKELKHAQRHLPYDKDLQTSLQEYQSSREEDLLKEEQQQRLRMAIGQLKQEQRTALVLYAFKDFSYNDIAEVMQVSLSKVESLIFRAKKNLRKMLS